MSQSAPDLPFDERLDLTLLLISLDLEAVVNADETRRDIERRMLSLPAGTSYHLTLPQALPLLAGFAGVLVTRDELEAARTRFREAGRTDDGRGD